jgi:hypothetical protein
MSRVRDSRRLSIVDSGSPLTFAREDGGAFKAWDRFLLLNGTKADHRGNICDTCGFFFERLDGANASVSPSEVVTDLTAGLRSVSASAVNQIQKIVPDGEYVITLNEVSPSLTFPGSDDDYFVKDLDSHHDPKTEYYRAETRQFNGSSCFFEFIIPMLPLDRLDTRRVREMRELIEAGRQPTALALSVLDVTQPWWLDFENRAVTEHWCLAHYLIDGHHKMYAASQCHRPITLLTFLALDQGASEEKQILKVLETLATQPSP